MKKLTLIICLTLVSGFAFSQWIEQNHEFANPQLQLNSIFFTDTSTGYIASSKAIMKTIDGGETWNESFYGGFNSVFFTDANTGFAVGGYGKIIKTIDGGELWIELSSGTTSTLISVYFTDSIAGFAVGYDFILKTIDGGETWTSLSFENTIMLSSVYFANANNGCVVGCGTILKTIDGGINWANINLSIGKHEDFYSVFFTDANTGYVVGGCSNQAGLGCHEQIIMKTIDGGTTWLTLMNNPGSPFKLVFFTDAKTGYVVGDGDWDKGTNYYKHIILKTIDGGTTWDTLSHRSPGGLNSVFFTDANTGFAVGRNGTILKTTNGGGFPTAVENVSLESTFTVYPNPATNKISIATQSNLQGETTICIFNMNGEILQQEKFQSQSLIEMDVSVLAKGIYLLQIQTKAGVENKKLVVQ